MLFWLPGLFSSATLLVLGTLGLSHAIESTNANLDERTEYSVQDEARDSSIIEKLEAFIETQALS